MRRESVRRESVKRECAWRPGAPRDSAIVSPSLFNRSFRHSQAGQFQACHKVRGSVMTRTKRMCAPSHVVRGGIHGPSFFSQLPAVTRRITTREQCSVHGPPQWPSYASGCSRCISRPRTSATASTDGTLGSLTEEDASGACEKNAHPVGARYSITLPPVPPTSMLAVFLVSFALRKKTVTFARSGFCAQAPTLKWGVRGAGPPFQGLYG